MAIDSFVDSLITRAVITLQVNDTSIVGETEDDPLIRELAYVAYSQICAYCSRKFMLDTYEEEYHSVYDKLSLRNSPVLSVFEVWVDDVELIVDVDYKVIKNSIKFLNRQSLNFTNVSSTKDIDVLVKYDGGFESAEEFPDLFDALLLQTIALYNRRNNLGVSSVSASMDSANINQASDVGDLLDAVKTIMSPYVNYSDVDYA